MFIHHDLRPPKDPYVCSFRVFGGIMGYLLIADPQQNSDSVGSGFAPFKIC